MASKRQRNRALKRRQRINESDLQPGIAAGLTQGASAKEALEQFPVPNISTTATLRGLEESFKQKVGRVPLPTFYGTQDNDSDFYIEFPDGRKFRDTRRAFPPEVIKAFMEGMICFKCLEPQDAAFGDDHIPGCEGVALAGPRYMKKRQLIDIAAELEGNVYLGPEKPLTQFMDEQDERVEKRQFIRRVLDGGQGKIPKDWLRDATLLDGLSPQERRRIGEN